MAWLKTRKPGDSHPEFDAYEKLLSAPAAAPTVPPARTALLAQLNATAPVIPPAAASSSALPAASTTAVAPQATAKSNSQRAMSIKNAVAKVGASLADGNVPTSAEYLAFLDVARRFFRGPRPNDLPSDLDAASALGAPAEPAQVDAATSGTASAAPGAAPSL